MNFDGTPILFVPWINPSNYEASIDALETANADIAMGHLEVNGFEMHKGQMAEGSWEKILFVDLKQYSVVTFIINQTMVISIILEPLSDFLE